MATTRKTQRWALTGDWHTNSMTGLSLTPSNPIQAGVLDRFKDAIKWFGDAPDVLVINGDQFDGKDEKGHDVDEHCMCQQADNAAQLAVMWNPSTEYILCTGTRYHDAHHTQEFIFAMKRSLQYWHLREHGTDIKVTIRRKLKTTINGWFRLEMRHFIGGSSIPHGRATAILREQMWNVLNAALKARTQDKPVKWPNLLCFSHRHYYMGTDNAWGDAVVLPCWQAVGSKAGDEIFGGHVDMGMVRLTVGAKEDEGWQREKRLYQAAVVDRTDHR